MTRRLGLAHLSLLGHPPTTIVDTAATVGYDFVGLRVRPVTATEPAFDLRPGSSMLTDTLRRLDDTGLDVVDIEFLVLDGSDVDVLREIWLPMYETGAALGASTFTVAASDTDRSRLVDTLDRLVEDGRGAGITPTLEAISYQAVSTVTEAAEIARQAGARILLDALHIGRAGTHPRELTGIADLAPLVQLCDGPMPGPTSREGRIGEARSERLAPGAGGLRCAEILRALPADLPISVEAPDTARLERLGPEAWARELHEATTRLLREVEMDGAS